MDKVPPAEMPGWQGGQHPKEVVSINSQKAERTSLKRLRAEIDELDRRLFSVIAERMSLVSEIGRLKRQLGLPTSDPVREAQLKARLKELTAGVLDPQHIEDLSSAILRVSGDLQEGADRESRE